MPRQTITQQQNRIRPLVLLLCLSGCTNPFGMFASHKPAPLCTTEPICSYQAKTKTTPTPQGKTSPAVAVKNTNYIPPPPRLSFDDGFKPSSNLLSGTTAGYTSTTTNKTQARDASLNLSRAPRPAVQEESLTQTQMEGSKNSGDGSQKAANDISLILGAINHNDKKTEYIQMPQRKTKEEQSTNKPGGFNPLDDK